MNAVGIPGGTRPRRNRAVLIPFRRPDHVLDPREFDRFNLAGRLRDVGGYYTGGEAYLSIVGFPDSLLTAIDKVRHRTGVKPSRSAVIACCVEHGTKVFNEDQDVHALASMQERFNNIDPEDGDAEEVVAGFFRSFSSEVAIPGGQQKRRNLRIPEDISRPLAGLAEKLGMTQSNLAVVLIMLTLSTQPEVNAQQRERMANIVIAFLRRVKLRARGTQALIEALLE